MNAHTMNLTRDGLISALAPRPAPSFLIDVLRMKSALERGFTPEELELDPFVEDEDEADERPINRIAFMRHIGAVERA